MGIAPRRAERRQISADRSEELVERVVHKRALVERGDARELLGIVDRLDAEQVAHEVGERADRPCLQAGGRRDGVDDRG